LLILVAQYDVDWNRHRNCVIKLAKYDVYTALPAWSIMTRTAPETDTAYQNGPVWRNWETHYSVKLVHCDAELHRLAHWCIHETGAACR
jgi:hypothetical protein